MAGNIQVWVQVVYRDGADYGEKTLVDVPKGGNIDALKEKIIGQLDFKVSARRVAVRVAANGNDEDPAGLVKDLKDKCDNPIILVLLDQGRYYYQSTTYV